MSFDGRAGGNTVVHSITKKKRRLGNKHNVLHPSRIVPMMMSSFET